MSIISLELLTFLAASLLSVGLIYYQVPKSTLFVILSILLASLLVFYSKFPLSVLQTKGHKPHMLSMLFSGGLFIQLLLVATGGFFSAFVIILHLFTLGMSFVFNISSAIAYLVFSVGVLITTIVFDPQMNLLFHNDPWSFLLHGISFLVVIPLAHIVVSSYHLKDSISKMLTEHLATKELQDESIFRGIGEFVLITDQNTKVIFANESVKKALGLEAKELIGEDILAVLPLSAETGIAVDRTTLSIDQAISDRSVHKVTGFSLTPKQGGRRLPILLQVRPIFGSNGALKQIVFVLTPDVGATAADLIDRDQLRSRRQLLMEEIESQLQSSSDQTAHEHFLFLMAQIDDLLLYQEIERHGITEHKVLFDGVEYLKSVIIKQAKVTAILNVEIDISNSQEELVRFATETGVPGFSLYSHLKNNFLVSFDQSHFSAMIERIIKLLLILNMTSDKKKVTVRLGFNDADQFTVLCAVQASPSLLLSVDQLMLQQYGTSTNNDALSLGSGLEGLLVKRIAESTNSQFSIIASKKSPTVVLLLSLPKGQ